MLIVLERVELETLELHDFIINHFLPFLSAFGATIKALYISSSFHTIRVCNTGPNNSIIVCRI